jgi:IS30 family transposase
MVMRLRGHGLGWKEVARAVGCSRSVAWRTGEGQQKHPGRPATWTPRPGRLTIQDREEIVVGLATGETYVAIALRIGKAPSTVSREVAANGGREAYRAWGGYLRAVERTHRPKLTKFTTCPRLVAAVTEGLEEFWSPEEISRRLRHDHPDDPMMQVSHETIYQSLYVQGRGELRRELARSLRTGRVQRRPQG